MNKLIILFIGMILVLGSCENLEDRSFDPGPEKFYPPRVLDTKGFSGYKRAKITWTFSATNVNTAKKIRINIRGAAIGYKNSITIDELVNSYEITGLKEDVNYTFSVQTIDSNGNLSIVTPQGGQSCDVFVYGDFFIGLKNELPLVVAKGSGICAVDFKRGNDAILKADIVYGNKTDQGKDAYYIDGLSTDGTPVNITYTDYRFYKTSSGVLGLDAIKVQKSDVIAVSSSYKLTDKVVFAEPKVKVIAGDITYDDWQNKTNKLTLNGAIPSFKDLYLCRSLTTLVLDATGGQSTTSPDAAPINFLIAQGKLKRIVIADDAVYSNIKSKIIDQSIITKE